MSINVRVSKSPSFLTANIVTTPRINTNISKVLLSLVNLEELNNVDIETNGLQNGFTLIYNAITNQWIAQPAANTLDNIDGGIY